MEIETIYEIQRIKQVKEAATIKSSKTITGPKVAYELVKAFIGDDDREVFFVMCLNTKNKIVAVHRCHVGAINSSVVHPREVFKAAILNNSASIVVSHQHPSGDPTPSQEDIHVTRRLAESGKMLGIEVLDSIVAGDDTFVSLKEKGYL